jgi:hypothetical protein
MINSTAKDPGAGNLLNGLGELMGIPGKGSWQWLSFIVEIQCLSDFST